ncbi:hypothetical protein GCM10010435_10330 [Winogradskya consettensis]|uniref:Uncharacterized protein n=1 Tax=Winogradskya consettensis TaxID=113560 RepID=A0A919T068_9ACTN|nr:hypothetical protein Aco04nite_76750 [Actinoplanes consettensis]
MVLGLGELGVAPAEWLTDADFGVRVCAALAPGLAGDETAAEVLRFALLDPAALDGLSLHQLPLITRPSPRLSGTAPRSGVGDPAGASGS